MKLKCVIVDDEPLAIEGLTKYAEVVDYLELAAVAQHPLELDKLLGKERIDLIFLDIQMPYMSGLDFLKIKTQLPMVILTTAFPNYAVEGFQLDVIDYLLKPITFNRFFKATNKAREYHALKNQKVETAGPGREQEYLFIKCEHKYEKINIPDILFVQAMQNYVTIYTTKGKFMTLLPLKKVEDYLDPNLFLRVHKSYLVALSRIDCIENGLITIQGHEIAVSRPLREQVLDLVVKSRLLGK